MQTSMGPEGLYFTIKGNLTPRMNCNYHTDVCMIFSEVIQNVLFSTALYRSAEKQTFAESVVPFDESIPLKMVTSNLFQ